jgi:hypothetical protein
MTTEQIPDVDDVEQLIQRLNDDGTPWEVDDWWYEVGAYEEAEVTLDLRWCPDASLDVGMNQDQATVREIITDLSESGSDAGAPISDVVTVARDEGIDDPKGELTALKQQGEVYEPQEGIWRVA